MRVHTIIALLLLASAMLAACVDSSTVMTTSTIRALPVGPESAWQDLLTVADAGRHYDAANVFSRRHLRQRFVGGQLTTYPVEREEYEATLSRLDGELAMRVNDVEDYGQSICEVIQAMGNGGGAFLVDRNASPGTSYAYYRKDNGMPWGPNTATVVVKYWRRGIADGEGVSFRVALVQEYEEWKIDEITPNLAELSKLADQAEARAQDSQAQANQSKRNSPSG